MRVSLQPDLARVAFAADLARHGDRPAVLTGEHVLSYRELAARVEDLAARLGTERRLAVLAATGHRSRLILDVCGHRERRNVALRTAAQAAVERVRAGEGPVHLESMGAYERKIVHDVVADAGLTSESEGEGARRHVVISADD